MASLRRSIYPSYVFTDDSDSQPVSWNTPFLKFTVLTFSLITVAVVGLYFAGIVRGEIAVEEVLDDSIPSVELWANKYEACDSYSMITGNCTDIDTEQIIENGCMAYVERSGNVCAQGDNTTLCVVNEDCNTADFLGTSEPSPSNLNGPNDVLCNSYSKVVDACIDVSVEEISENGCISYVESTGGICVYFDESRTLCIVNEVCDKVENLATLLV